MIIIIAVQQQQHKATLFGELFMRLRAEYICRVARNLQTPWFVAASHIRAEFMSRALNSIATIVKFLGKPESDAACYSLFCAHSEIGHV